MHGAERLTGYTVTAETSTHCKIQRLYLPHWRPLLLLLLLLL